VSSWGNQTLFTNAFSQVVRTFAAYYKMGQDKGFPPMGIQANAKVKYVSHFSARASNTF
jgi:hypothetical protein